MQLSLAITMLCAVGLVFGIPFVYNENDDLSMVSMDDDGKSHQQGGVNFRVYHKLNNIAQLFDAVLKDKDGTDIGNSGNSNGDDGSHKPPSKRALTPTDQAHILQLHHSKSPFFQLPDMTWNHKASNLAQVRVNKCGADVFSEKKQSYHERFAIGHTSWNDVLSAWWDKDIEREDYVKTPLNQLTSQKKSASVGCAMQNCPHGPYYACNYIFSSNDLDDKY